MYQPFSMTLQQKLESYWKEILAFAVKFLPYCVVVAGWKKHWTQGWQAATSGIFYYIIDPVFSSLCS